MPLELYLASLFISNAPHNGESYNGVSCIGWGFGCCPWYVDEVTLQSLHNDIFRIWGFWSSVEKKLRWDSGRNIWLHVSVKKKICKNYQI